MGKEVERTAREIVASEVRGIRSNVTDVSRRLSSISYDFARWQVYAMHFTAEEKDIVEKLSKAESLLDEARMILFDLE